MSRLLARLRRAAGFNRAPNSPPPPVVDFPFDPLDNCARCECDLAHQDDQVWVSQPTTATTAHVRMVCRMCVQRMDKLLLDPYDEKDGEK